MKEKQGTVETAEYTCSQRAASSSLVWPVIPKLESGCLGAGKAHFN